jgi:hypothetical protein
MQASRICSVDKQSIPSSSLSLSLKAAVLAKLLFIEKDQEASRFSKKSATHRRKERITAKKNWKNSLYHQS